MLKTKGFVLMEVLIDCALVGIAAVIAGNFVTLANYNSIEEHRITAVFIAQEEIEKLRLKELKNDELVSSVIRNHFPYRVTIKEADAGKIGILKQAEVIVSWQEKDVEYQYKLVTIFRKELKVDE